MKKIIATTAISLMLSTAAFADAHTGSFKVYEVEQTGDLYASNFIGMRIYSAEKDYDGFNSDTMVDAGAETEWDDIGEVNDVILGRDGMVKAVILGVGGFIGIGEKDVAVDMSSIKIVNEKDDADDFFLVVKTSKEELEAAPTYSRLSKEEMAEAKDDVDTMKAADRKMLMTPTMQREGYDTAKVEDLTTEDLTGARLYGAKDEDIGEIDQLIVDDSGKIKEAVLDIGGFLGMGEHRIAVTMEELQIMRQGDGDDVRIYINATKEELEAQPVYEG